jgi:hypothetical protein
MDTLRPSGAKGTNSCTERDSVLNKFRPIRKRRKVMEEKSKEKSKENVFAVIQEL